MKLGKVEITHKDKNLFKGISKKEFVKYYSNVSKKMLKFLKSRPLVMKRYPKGISKKGFYQKEYPDYFPNYINSIKVKERQGGKKKYSVIDSRNALVYIANQDCIEFHTWLSNTYDLNKPDKVVFDLDPSKGFKQVYDCTWKLKELLDKLKLKSYLMSTGLRGVHIVVPIRQELGFDEVKDFADSVATKLSNEDKGFTTEIRKNKRKGRLFIDVARNSYAQTSICPYSVRASNSASVAVPLSWNELTKNFNPKSYTIKNVLDKEYSWKGYNKTKNSVKKVIKSI